jgi:3-methyladenine DNA glycosylase AlkD
MRGQFAFLGIPTPKRKALSKECLGAAKKATAADWAFVGACWQREEREFQYLAVDYLSAAQRLLTPKDMPALRELIVAKSWWDTVDGLDKIAGGVALAFPEVNPVLLAWSTDGNFWLRRAAIDCQRGRKEKTDTDLLKTILENNLGQTEFFINKAIGWSLREYGKTNPDWVRAFIEGHRAGMAALSVREGGKYLGQCTAHSPQSTVKGL